MRFQIKRQGRQIAAFGFALAAGPALAQIITVPLDPIDPNEVQPGEIAPIEPLPGEPLAPGQFFPAPNNGLDNGGMVLDPIDPITPRAPGSIVGEDVLSVEEDVVATGTGAVLRGLDKLAGSVEDLTLKSGESTTLGWLQVSLGECRYPVDNPSGDAYAWVEVREEADAAPIFEGWMVASSPALNALDHSRFDVWVINCTTE